MHYLRNIEIKIKTKIKMDHGLLGKHSSYNNKLKFKHLVSVFVFGIPRLNIANRCRFLGQLKAGFLKSDIARHWYELTTTI